MNSFNTLSEIEIDGNTYFYHSLPALEKNLNVTLSWMPYGHKILLENLLRHEDGEIVKKEDILAFVNQDPKIESNYEIQFTAARVLLQDFTGVPVVADLGAMRAAMALRSGDTARINPLQPVDLVIDHSVQVDYSSQPDSIEKNLKKEFERNSERYQFLKWGQQAFRNFQVVPPGAGICHQVNIEYLAHVAMFGKMQGKNFIYPDTVVGTDSHTPMVNALGVVGWGVGGIEAEAAMLGQPSTMLIPQVVGFELTGKLPVGTTATDLILTITQLLRKKGVVGKFVEYFGDGVANLSLADRATISNMSPECGATVGVFPVDDITIEYLKKTGREDRANRTEKYFKAQNLFAKKSSDYSVKFSDVLKLDLATVEPSLAGPSKPHDRTSLKSARNSFRKFAVSRLNKQINNIPNESLDKWLNDNSALFTNNQELNEKHPDINLSPLGMQVPVSDGAGKKFNLTNGSIIIAAITSCTNTSNPDLMIGAALLARNAAARGLKSKPWVKTSFAPGSTVVTDYLTSANLLSSLESLGFGVVGYGCTTCIGNSGPLDSHIQKAIDNSKNLITVSVLSGNRNFEARIHPTALGNYLMSPPLVVAYALAGNINLNLEVDPLGFDTSGLPVFLKDIWPDHNEIAELVSKFVNADKFKNAYSTIFNGETNWQNTHSYSGSTYNWTNNSTYIKQPPFFDKHLIDEAKVTELIGARILGIFGDFITTDHISPAGAISPATPAGQYLTNNSVSSEDFNSYGSRRGNHEVMVRGTFANVRIRNLMVTREGGYTKVWPEGREATIFEASEVYKKTRTPLVVFAGKEYGSGSSRDWAAKGPRLLGVRVVVAESFERIHRSNLVGMGVLPVQLESGITIESLKLIGDEIIDVIGLDKLTPKAQIILNIYSSTGQNKLTLKVNARVDTNNEIKYFRSGGILPYMLNQLSN